MKFSNVTIPLMVLIACLMYVHSIKCYQCRSDLHDDCEVLQNVSYLRDCRFSENSKQELSKEEQEAFCRKISLTLYFTEVETPLTIRECAFHHDILDECYKVPWPIVAGKTCDCGEEACNNVNSIKQKAPFLTKLYCTCISVFSILRIIILRKTGTII